VSVICQRRRSSKKDYVDLSKSYKGAGALSAVFENAAGNEARGDDSYLGDDR